MTRPTIDVDCNNVAFVVGGKGKDARTKTGAFADHLVKWSGCGLRVGPICDDTHPIAKQATNLHRANYEWN